MQNRFLQFADIINCRKIIIVHQPIFDLAADKVVGYEALARGPEGYFHKPETLFRYAADYDVLLELDQLCFETALAAAKPGFNFINLVPDNVSRIHFPEDAPTLRGRLVVEITERRIDRTVGEIKATLDQWKEVLAVRVAVDDVGQGALTNVADLRPDFVKIDRSLVSGCDRDGAPKVVLKHLARMAADMGIEVVAEGLERQEEVEAVRGLGIRYGQGYFLGRPRP